MSMMHKELNSEKVKARKHKARLDDSLDLDSESKKTKNVDNNSSLNDSFIKFVEDVEESAASTQLDEGNIVNIYDRSMNNKKCCIIL